MRITGNSSILRKLGYRTAEGERLMDRRYEQFNEMTFEAYVKSAIDKAVLKARKRQAAREKVEQSFSTMTDVELFALSQEDQGIKQTE